MIKLEPVYGVYPWWPQDGHDWIHPDDVALVDRLIPSSRIFRRERVVEGYYLLTYGAQSIRILPSMWLQVRHEGLDVGDPVEVLSRLGKNRPFVARITEMRWHRHSRTIHYIVRRAGKLIPRRYTAHDLQVLVPKDTLAAQHTALRDRPLGCQRRGE